MVPMPVRSFQRRAPPPGLERFSATAARARLTNWLRDQMVSQHFETEMAFGPATLRGDCRDGAATASAGSFCRTRVCRNSPTGACCGRGSAAANGEVC